MAIDGDLRYARQALQRMMSHQTIDKRGLAFAAAIAERIDQDPAHHAVELARERCLRWTETEPCHGAAVWLEILSLPWSEIKARLLDPSERGNDLRQNNPFCGVLTNQERWSIIREYRNHDTTAT